MAIKENFISMAPDEESSAKVSLIDNNKTLMIDQYTSDVEPGNPELVEDIHNINEAFEHFKPSVEVDFVDEVCTPGTPARKAYLSGMMQQMLETREDIIKAARNGSNPAQSELLRFLEKQLYSMNKF